ncbi:hypothetical protein FPHOBKDP_00135 [Listeria phage LPJP1]|nr:hypothetical protein FPHOBKDP_00135 [Listeria phage LPJP1]
MTEEKGYIIMESVTESKPKIIDKTLNNVLFETELQEADAPEQKNRIYDRRAIDEAIQNPIVQEKIKNRTFFGEAGHPLNTDNRRQLYIDQRNISHIVTEAKFDGNRLIGRVETADTSVGRDMKGLINQGSKAAFSMRGIGNIIKPDGKYQRVHSPLMICCYDWVVIPSHPNSYMTHRINEDFSEDYQGLLEAASSNSYNLSGKVVPYQVSELLEFVTKKSENVYSLAESLGISMNLENGSVTLTEDQTLSIKQSNETIRIYLEEEIKRDLSKYIQDMF